MNFNGINQKMLFAKMANLLSKDVKRIGRIYIFRRAVMIGEKKELVSLTLRHRSQQKDYIAGNMVALKLKQKSVLKMASGLQSGFWVSMVSGQAVAK